MQVDQRDVVQIRQRESARTNGFGPRSIRRRAYCRIILPHAVKLRSVQYHTGFRSQVESWPTNPVSYYISTLTSYPAKTVIVDLGCGDAALARALVPKGMAVISFDLVSDGTYVVEADTCTRVPLPGSEPHDSQNEGEGQIVDVVICALSLMGTNWPGCIREAWRILRPGCVPSSCRLIYAPYDSMQRRSQDC